jgi:ABC-2 type transport system permease protein
MNDDITRNARPGTVYSAGPELWRRVPDFEYQPPSTPAVLRHAAVSIGLLAAWLAGSLAFAARSAAAARVD